jgi:hypothetical protein
MTRNLSDRSVRERRGDTRNRPSIRTCRPADKSAPTVGTFEIQIAHNPIITSNIVWETKLRFEDILNKHFS